MFVELANLNEGDFFDYCIIGTGPAGMTCARALSAADKRILLLKGGGLAGLADKRILLLEGGGLAGLPSPVRRQMAAISPPTSMTSARQAIVPVHRESL